MNDIGMDLFLAYEDGYKAGYAEAKGKGSKMKIKLDHGAIMPTRAHETDAGLDLYAREAKRIEPRGSATFDTGVHIELPHGFFGKIESKSGLNVNYGIVSCGGDRGSGGFGSTGR